MFNTSGVWDWLGPLGVVAIIMTVVIWAVSHKSERCYMAELSSGKKITCCGSIQGPGWGGTMSLYNCGSNNDQSYMAQQNVRIMKRFKKGENK